ncbi:Hypothetical predicted protein [Octopus vulgaris]|uniref:Uncharacterized protein n=2 Tax=Octopus TaxID=6643 RepID=A0AA36AIQ2_OCTVU|nr:uncharacterized protein LOC115228949 [Octopus sinensis]CAI9716920.1 Hypothetical predicted protein [Octopus vulgaris]
MSQVPGLQVYDGKPSRPYFKDSDSKYVRLAKERGVKDLLKHEETAGKPDAVPYNRVNWFYLEDNAVEDAQKKKSVNWTFGAPEYMSTVPSPHSESSETKEDYEVSSPKECEVKPVKTEPAGLNKKPETYDHPFIHGYYSPTEPKESKTEEREEEYVSDQLSEGNDIENVMAEPLPVTQQIKKATAHPQQWKNPITQTEISGDAPMKGSGKKCCPKENACTSMSKLLSFGYAQDWHSRKDGSGESNSPNQKP